MAAATAIAATGVLISAGSAGMSFSQAAKARRQGETAAAASKKLMKEAERKAEVEFMQKLNVPLDAYGREYKQNLQVQQQGIQALQEGDSRNLAAGVGRVGAAATESNEGTRIAMGKEMFDLEKMQVQEQSDINQDLKDMKVGAAADQQQISRDSDEAAAAAMQQGVASVGSAVQGAAAAIPLFPKSAMDNRANKLADQIMASGDPKKMMKTVVNQPGTTAEGQKTYADLSDPNSVNYDLNKAALFAPTTSTPRGRDEVLRAITNNFTKDQINRKGRAGFLKNFGADFYKYLNQ